MNTNSLNYEHCLRPTDTQAIAKKLNDNTSLNIVGKATVQGTTRLLKDIKALESQLPAVIIVYVNLREYKRTFNLFLQEVATQIGILESVPDFAKLSYHLRQKALTHQIWLLLDELDIAMEEKHEAYSYTFLEQLNSFKNATNINIGCVTSQPLNACTILTPNGSYGTSPLVLPVKTLQSLSCENIEKELKQHHIDKTDFITAINKHEEPHRFMQWLIKQETSEQKDWSTRKKIEVWEENYKKAHKPLQSWRKVGSRFDRFLITSGLIRLKGWIKAILGKE